MDPAIIIFAALALFLSYRLFSVLGTRGGHEPEEHERPVLRPVGGQESGEQGETGAEAAMEPETPRPPLPSWALPIDEALPGFDPENFLEGATAAYDMVVEAYAEGDLSSVRSFVDPEVLKSFAVAIDGREQAGQTVELTMVGIDRPDVVKTEIHGDSIRAELAFRSEQVRAVRSAAGEVVEGDPEKVVTVKDRWVFSRRTGTRDPNWTLVATQGSAAS